jgi:uncharacterized protein (TIGR00251 family)
MVKVRRTPAGVVIPVHVAPGASRDAIRGEHDGRLKVAVCAPPEKGRANKAVCELLARELNVKKSQVKVVSGHAVRLKEVLIERVSPDALDAIIRRD